MPKVDAINDEEWAVIAVIHTEPKYKFQYDEAKFAKKMEEKGLIQTVGSKMYAVTKLGEKLFSRGVVEND